MIYFHTYEKQKSKTDTLERLFENFYTVEKFQLLEFLKDISEFSYVLVFRYFFNKFS